MNPKCPRCGAETDLSSNNRWRPFCCERCRLIDLGTWADGGYRIPVHEPEPLAADAANEQATAPHLHPVDVPNLRNHD